MNCPSSRVHRTRSACAVRGNGEQGQRPIEHGLGLKFNINRGLKFNISRGLRLKFNINRDLKFNISRELRLKFNIN